MEANIGVARPRGGSGACAELCVTDGILPGLFFLWMYQSIHQGEGTLRNIHPRTQMGISPGALCVKPGYFVQLQHLEKKQTNKQQQIES